MRFFIKRFIEENVRFFFAVIVFIFPIVTPTDVFASQNEIRKGYFMQKNPPKIQMRSLDKQVIRKQPSSQPKASRFDSDLSSNDQNTGNRSQSRSNGRMEPKKFQLPSYKDFLRQ